MGNEKAHVVQKGLSAARPHVRFLRFCACLLLTHEVKAGHVRHIVVVRDPRDPVSHALITIVSPREAPIIQRYLFANGKES